MEFATFLESCFDDDVAYAKNTMDEGEINFKIEYPAEDGSICEYYPDFFIKTSENTFFIAETKGHRDLDDANNTQSKYTYTPIY